jgi:hypothetical protein
MLDLTIDGIRPLLRSWVESTTETGDDNRFEVGRGFRRRYGKGKTRNERQEPGTQFSIEIIVREVSCEFDS